jgi:type III secretion protein J
MEALSERVASTLNKISDVLTSRVHRVLPENAPFSDADTDASIAIFLTYKVGSNLYESVREIKYLMANSVQGLDYDKLSIALFPAAAEDNTAIENVFGTNVNAMGLRIASDAAIKFLTIVIVLGILLLCSMGAVVFFFLESRKSRKGTTGPKPAPNSPIGVQVDSQNASDLDEEPDTLPEEK